MHQDSSPSVFETSAPASLGREGLVPMFKGLHLKDEWIPRYRMRRVGERIVLTADHGAWMIVSDEELREIQSVALSEPLYRRLEAAGLIQTDDNAAELSHAWRTWCKHHYTGTSLHILGVTRRCNLKCLYCHAAVVPATADSERYDMPIETGRRIVDFAFTSPSPHIHFEFQGGEATLHPALIKDVHRYACAKNLAYGRSLTFSIVTNLVEVPDDVLEFLIEAGIRVTTTIELADEDEAGFRIDHDHRQRRADVERTRMRLKERGLLVPCLMVMARNNLHQARKYIDHAVECGQTSVFLSPVQKLGFGRAHWNEIGILADEYVEAWKDAQEYIFSLWDRGIPIIERQFAIALQKLYRDYDVRYMDFRNPNGMVLGNLAYDQNGNVFACDEGRAQPYFKVGNVFEHSYAELVSSPRAREIVSYSLRELPECQSCAYKPYCGVHPIVSYSESRNPVPVPLTDASCRLTLGIFDYMFDLIRRRPERIAQATFVHEVMNA